MTAKTQPGVIPEDVCKLADATVRAFGGSTSYLEMKRAVAEAIMQDRARTGVDAELIARLLWDRFASKSDGAWPTAMAGVYRSLAAEIITLCAAQSSRPDQPEAPGVEAAYEEYRSHPISDDVDGFSSATSALRHAFFAGARAAFLTSSSDRIRQETAEERISEDERDRLRLLAHEQAFDEADITRSRRLYGIELWLSDNDGLLPDDRAAKRTEGGR